MLECILWQNKLLEEAAQRLYKEWFVDFHFPEYEDVEIIDGVPEGWSEFSLSEIADAQIEILSEARDRLLPKLMSGEIEL